MNSSTIKHLISNAILKKHKLSVREKEHQKNVLEDKRAHAVAREKNHQKI
jgi:hypothetical protein